MPKELDFNPESYSFKDGEFYKGEEVFIGKEVIEEKGFNFSETGDLLDGEEVKEAKDDFLKNYETRLVFETAVAEQGLAYDPEKGFINKEGQPIFKPEALVDDKGVAVKFNENGDQIDAEGNVIQTKDEVLASYLDSDPNAAINDVEETPEVDLLAKKTGIQLLDENNKPIQFENSIEGLAKREITVRERSLKEGESIALKQFFTNNPDVYEAFLHKQTYGTLESFGNTVDYNKVEVKEDNKTQMISLIRQARIYKGDSKEEADIYINAMEDAGRTKELATASLTFLKQRQDKLVQEGQAKALAAQAQQAEQFANYQKEISTKIVKEGKIQLGDTTLAIPEILRVSRDGKVQNMSREDFVDYYTTPAYRDKTTGEQLTQYDYDARQQSVDYEIYDALKLFLGGEEQLIKEIRSQHDADKIKSIFQQTKRGSIFKSAVSKRVEKQEKDLEGNFVFNT